MNTPLTIVEVAIPRPFFSTLDYYIELPIEKLTVGGRVQVPLATKQCIGVVLNIKPQTTSEHSQKLKPITEVIDQQPILDSYLCQFLRWSANYYHHPIGEVIFSALPVLLRGSKAVPQPIYWQAIENKSSRELLKRAKRQQALYQWLSTQEVAINEKAIQQFHGTGWKKSIEALYEKSLITKLEKPPVLPALKARLNTTLRLTEEQENTLLSIQQAFESKKPQPYLLHGITGSGKTEIYLRSIEPYLAAHKQALVLVPEIGLTPQLLQRFTNYYGEAGIVCLHSGLNDTERLEAWQQASQQQAQIIIGTRSAIFTPLPQLGIIIVDEEHDASFKQQETFRYHGRDLAIKRAHDLNIPIILGSATPSLESLYKVEQKRFHYGYIGKRPNATPSPSLQIQDIRGMHLESGLTRYTLERIQQTLDKQEQVMLFINRRGFARMLHCPQCGWSSECDHCSSHMTYHARRSRLVCHHCTTEQPAPEHCPKCHYEGLISIGQGTERLELTLSQHFRNVPVIRIDRDSTSRKGALQNQLEQIKQQDQAILIGTQMLAKGHDFPNLTLVVILEVDQSLFSNKYHALERFGQLLVQVAGRAGRAQKRGHVLLQTLQPEHPALQILLHQGYLKFAQQLLTSRQNWQYPPYSFQTVIRANALNMQQALQTLQLIRGHLENLSLPELEFMGPVQAFMEQRAGRYRAHLLLKSPNRKQLHQALHYFTKTYKQLKIHYSVRWSLDIDPIDLN